MLLEGLRHLAPMGGPWEEILPVLRKRGIVPTASVRQDLMELEDLQSVLDCAEAVGFERGFLTAEILEDMMAVWRGKQRMMAASSTKSAVASAPSAAPAPVQLVTDLGRTIAPVHEPEPLDIQFRNNLPDWKESDFSEQASDASSDILVHFDITGNSTTEGKMSDITSCFSDRLQSIRKMIIQNSRLPRTPTEIARLHAESSRYQGYENKAVAIGLVNEPRYTKNGHLIWNLEDETGELTCLLTKRKGDDRDRAHEQILEAGLMPDDVLGVSGTFSQTGDMFYVDDLHFPM